MENNKPVVKPELHEALKDLPHVHTVYINEKGEWHFTEVKGFHPHHVSDLIKPKK